MTILISILCVLMLLILALDYLVENWWSDSWRYDIWLWGLALWFKFFYSSCTLNVQQFGRATRKRDVEFIDFKGA